MAQNDDAQTVYVVRMKLGSSIVEYGLRANRIAIGYRETPSLIEIAADKYKLRETIKEVYGWVAGPPVFDGNLPHGAGYYRDVEWLNNGQFYPRSGLPSDVQKSLKYTWGTCEEAKGILEQVLAIEKGHTRTDRTFQENLREHLANEALEKLLKGNMNEKRFESFLRTLFEHRLGASGSGRSGASDKGADIVLEVPQPRPLPTLRVAIQAKYHKPTVGPEAVDQILRGMAEEAAHLGLVVTTGEFSEGAFEKANEETASIGLVDGEMLARMIVDFP